MFRITSLVISVSHSKSDLHTTVESAAAIVQVILLLLILITHISFKFDMGPKKLLTKSFLFFSFK